MSFSRWLLEIWAEHIDEVLVWEKKIPEYTAQEYFAKYKWWLRREYRHQKNELQKAL